MREVEIDEQYQTTLKAAQKQMANALEKALASFPEWQSPQARVDLANYVLGYLGVSWGLKFGK